MCKKRRPEKSRYKHVGWVTFKVKTFFLYILYGDIFLTLIWRLTLLHRNRISPKGVTYGYIHLARNLAFENVSINVPNWEAYNRDIQGFSKKTLFFFTSIWENEKKALENEKIEKCMFFCPKIENSLKMAIMSLNQF